MRRSSPQEGKGHAGWLRSRLILESLSPRSSTGPRTKKITSDYKGFLTPLCIGIKLGLRSHENRAEWDATGRQLCHVGLGSAVGAELFSPT